MVLRSVMLLVLLILPGFSELEHLLLGSLLHLLSGKFDTELVLHLNDFHVGGPALVFRQALGGASFVVSILQRSPGLLGGSFLGLFIGSSLLVLSRFSLSFILLPEIFIGVGLILSGSVGTLLGGLLRLVFLFLGVLGLLLISDRLSDSGILSLLLGILFSRGLRVDLLVNNLSDRVDLRSTAGNLRLEVSNGSLQVLHLGLPLEVAGFLKSGKISVLFNLHLKHVHLCLHLVNCGLSVMDILLVN